MNLTTFTRTSTAPLVLLLVSSVAASAGCGSESESRVVMPEKYMPVPGPDAVYDPTLGGGSQKAAPAQ